MFVPRSGRGRQDGGHRSDRLAMAANAHRVVAGFLQRKSAEWREPEGGMTAVEASLHRTTLGFLKAEFDRGWIAMEAAAGAPAKSDRFELAEMAIGLARVFVQALTYVSFDEDGEGLAAPAIELSPEERACYASLLAYLRKELARGALPDEGVGRELLDLAVQLVETFHASKTGLPQHGPGFFRPACKPRELFPEENALYLQAMRFVEAEFGNGWREGPASPPPPPGDEPPPAPDRAKVTA